MRAATLILAAIAALGFVTFLPDTASAQGACSGAPGEMVVGMSGGGPGGYQTPLCSSPGGGAGGAPRRSDAEVMNDAIGTAYQADIVTMMMGLHRMQEQIEKRQNIWKEIDN